MNDEDKELFTQMMLTTCRQYSKSPFDENVSRLWYHSLKIFDFSTISRSMEKWILTSKFMPTVSDIVKLCRLEISQRSQANQIPYKVDKSRKQEFQKKLQEALTSAKLKNYKHPKMWAVRILNRHKNGDYDSIVGLEMAKEVVDNLNGRERQELKLD
jgi:hypothetical protein